MTKDRPVTALGLALVGVAAVAALVLARPEAIPRELVPPPRSAVAAARETVATAETAPADPGAEIEAPEEPAQGYALTRQDFETAITKVRSQALACKDEATPPAVPVKLTIAPSGVVSSVLLPEGLRATRAGECIVRAMRGAAFPPYRSPPVPAVEWLYNLRFSGTD